LIRGAALDVFSKEPLIDNSPLRQLDNLVLTPHLGASTEEAQKRVGEMAVHQVIQFFDHNNLLNEVKV
jgi:D-3-phosphoglycerate dehydrogenase